MRSWVNNEDGPDCECGEPTVVKLHNGGAILMCFFHTGAEGCYFELPPMAPDNFSNMTYAEVFNLEVVKG